MSVEAMAFKPQEIPEDKKNDIEDEGYFSKAWGGFKNKLVEYTSEDSAFGKSVDWAKDKIEALNKSDRLKFLEGLANIGNNIDSFKNGKLQEISLGFAMVCEKNKTLKNYFLTGAEIYGEKKEKADEALEKSAKGELKDLGRVKGAGRGLAGNLLRYGRIIHDFDRANPFRNVMAASMFVGSQSEQIKKTRFKSEELLNKTRIGQLNEEGKLINEADFDRAWEEAYELYKKAEKEGDSENVSAEDLNKVYRENLPADVLKRFERNKDGEALKWMQKGMTWHMKHGAEKVMKEMDSIEKADISEPEKETKRQAILARNKKLLDDLDSMVEDQGTIDTFSYVSRLAEKGGKTAATVLTVETGFKTVTNLGKIGVKMGKSFLNWEGTAYGDELKNPSSEGIESFSSEEGEINSGIEVSFDNKTIELSDKVFKMKAGDFSKWLQSADKKDLGKILDYKEAHYTEPISNERVLSIFKKFHEDTKEGSPSTMQETEQIGSMEGGSVEEIPDKIAMDENHLKSEIIEIRSTFKEAGLKLTPEAQARIDELHQAQLKLGKLLDQGKTNATVEIAPMKAEILPGGQKKSILKREGGLESNKKLVSSKNLSSQETVKPKDGNIFPNQIINQKTEQLKEENFQITEGIKAKRGDSIWTVAEKYLAGNKEFKALKSEGRLHEALETYNIDRIKDTIVENPTEYGLAGNVNVDKLTIKQINSINWQKAFNDTYQEDSITKNLSDAKVEGIMESNKAMEAALHSHEEVKSLNDFEKVEVPESLVDGARIHIDNQLVIEEDSQFAREWGEWKDRKAINFINGRYGEAVGLTSEVDSRTETERDFDYGKMAEKRNNLDALEMNHRELLRERLHNVNDLVGAPTANESIEDYMGRYNIANTEANASLYRNLIHEGIVNNNPKTKDIIWSRIDKMPSALKGAVVKDFNSNKEIVKGYLNLVSGNKASVAEGVKQIFNYAKVNPADIDVRSNGSIVYNNAFGRKGYDLVLSRDKIGVDGPWSHNWNVSGFTGKTPEGKLSLDSIKDSKAWIINDSGGKEGSEPEIIEPIQERETVGDSGSKEAINTDDKSGSVAQVREKTTGKKITVNMPKITEDAKNE